MLANRLNLALKLLAPSDWERFERLASTFLVEEFPELRTTATASGDEGRDSELFSPLGQPRVLLQYSVAQDWRSKITKTVKRINETFPDALMLIYLSNHDIGAEADNLKASVPKNNGIALDVRDRKWFIERVAGKPLREAAAEELAEVIVDPFLSKEGVVPRSPSALSTPEAIAALTFLGLQWQDELRDKGLTKLAFEAIVRAALSDTNSDKRKKRSEVLDSVCRLLPDHPREQIAGLVDSALNSLKKRAISYRKASDDYCINYQETKRLADFKTTESLAELELNAAITSISRLSLQAYQLDETYLESVTAAIRNSADAVMLERSQAFAAALRTGSLKALASDDFSDTLTRQVNNGTLPKIKGIDWLVLLRNGVREVLLSNDSAIQEYMRKLADSYTLLAFLRETPDVQGAVEKMFSHGQIWLDTTIVLPLLADLLDEQPSGRFVQMIDAARAAGLRLFVTDGVLEEVERHMNRCVTCSSMATGWIGPIPYLLARYASTGRNVSAFSAWLEQFRGKERPREDIGDYLDERFGIGVRSLEEESKKAPDELRFALQRVWHDVHQKRRENSEMPIDDLTINKLVRHDVECYCGVIQVRTMEKASAFGYSAWWLTFDRTAFDIPTRLQSEMSGEVPKSPVLSADFLVNYLAFGPVRQRVDKSKESRLPLLMALGDVRYLTAELLQEADEIRKRLDGQPERVIQRQIRDHLDRARRHLGPISQRGLAATEEEVAA